MDDSFRIITVLQIPQFVTLKMPCMLRSRRLETPILQGFLSVTIAKAIFYTYTLKTGLLLRNTAIEN